MLLILHFALGLRSSGWSKRKNGRPKASRFECSLGSELFAEFSHETHTQAAQAQQSQGARFRDSAGLRLGIV